MQNNNIKLPIYLDYQATTPMDPRVIEVVEKEMREDFGNPHSRTHSFGWRAEESIEIARKQIAALINADPKEIFFTSGATESNNLAIKGVLGFYRELGKSHVITLTTEHKCLINSCRAMEQEGCKVTFLEVEKNGLVDLNKLEAAKTAVMIRPHDYKAVSFNVNTEIQPFHA